MFKKPENKISLFEKDLAKILASLAYHIAPEIVAYIVEKNKNEYQFFNGLFGDKIETKNYLFDGSACVFPGVRRYVSNKGKKQAYNQEYKAIIDDNVFPRHIWCFLYNGKGYSKPNWENFNEFELAHIFTHKESELKYEDSFFTEIKTGTCPYSEFTSAANVVLLPKGTVRPTDNSPIIKSVFYKRYIELYGEETLNGRRGFKTGCVPEWYKELEWNDPYLPKNWKKNIDGLLEYRKQRITEMLKKTGIAASPPLGPAAPPGPANGGGGTMAPSITIKGVTVPLRPKNNESIQDFIKMVLSTLLTNRLLPDSEIKNMMDKKYCRQTFSLPFPILQNDPAKITFSGGYIRYWTSVKFGENQEYWACSQWVGLKKDEYQEKLTAWIRKVKGLNEA